MSAKTAMVIMLRISQPLVALMQREGDTPRFQNNKGRLLSHQLIVPPPTQLNNSVHTSRKDSPKTHSQSSQESLESRTSPQFPEGMVLPGLISSDSKCEVDTGDSEEDERYDLEN